jgi:uncharacterized protein YdhG (YjbR/CyaY superfamily)
MKPAKNVGAYIAAAPKDVQPKLREVRKAIREVASDAVESISYGMPFYSFKGETGFRARLCYFGLLKGRVAFYLRPLVLEEHMDEAVGYMTSKSALQFPLDRPIPISLIKKLISNGIRKHVAGEDNLHARSSVKRSRRA